MGQKTDDKGQRKARARAKAKDGSPTRTLGEDERQKAGFPRYRGQQTEDRGQEKEKARARARTMDPRLRGNDGKLRVKGDGIYAGCLLNSDLLRLIPLEPL